MTASSNPQRFRLREPRPDGMDVMTSAELARALFAEVPCGPRPDNLLAPVSEWYCPAEACPVREVRVAMKYLDPDGPTRPPRLRCPACGGRLEFQHYLETKTLVPEAGPSDGG
jgi:hypothetical protein